MRIDNQSCNRHVSSQNSGSQIRIAGNNCYLPFHLFNTYIHVYTSIHTYIHLYNVCFAHRSCALFCCDTCTLTSSPMIVVSDSTSQVRACIHRSVQYIYNIRRSYIHTYIHTTATCRSIYLTHTYTYIHHTYICTMFVLLIDPVRCFVVIHVL